jgi:hypothetical protein
LAVQGHQHHRQVLRQPHHLISVVHLHLGLQRISVLRQHMLKQLVDAGPEQLNLAVVLLKLV